MGKNEKYIEIPTHEGSTKFIPHFTTIKCSAISNATGRVELRREHLSWYRFPMMPQDS
jgi:hypothetical protein